MSGYDHRARRDSGRGRACRAPRVLFLYRLAASGQPAPERAAYAKDNVGEEIKAQVVEVFGQRKLLKWTGPASRTSS